MYRQQVENLRNQLGGVLATLPAGRCTTRLTRRHVMKGLLLLLGAELAALAVGTGEGLRADTAPPKAQSAVSN